MGKEKRVKSFRFDGHAGRVPLPFHSTSDFRHRTSNLIFVCFVYFVVKFIHFYTFYTIYTVKTLLTPPFTR